MALLRHLATAAADRPAVRKTVLAVDLLIAAVALVVLYGAGGYGLEHPASDSTASQVLDWLLVPLLAAAALTTIGFAWGRPRRLAPVRAELGVAALLLWPAVCVTALAWAAVAY